MSSFDQGSLILHDRYHQRHKRDDDRSSVDLRSPDGGSFHRFPTTSRHPLHRHHRHRNHSSDFGEPNPLFVSKSDNPSV